MSTSRRRPRAGAWWRARRRHLPDAWEADYRVMVTGLGDYLRQVGLLQGPARSLGRHRFRHRRHHRGRRHRARERPLRDAAVRIHLRPLARGRGRCCGPPGLPARHGADHRSRRRGEGGAGAALRGTARGPDRGEHAVPPARPHAHGAVEQVRGDAADHRQQVRGRGGLRHDLRRHGGRLQPDQGPLQDPRVRDLPLAQRQSPPLDEGPGGRGRSRPA